MQAMSPGCVGPGGRTRVTQGLGDDRARISCATWVFDSGALPTMRITCATRVAPATVGSVPVRPNVRDRLTPVCGGPQPETRAGGRFIMLSGSVGCSHGGFAMRTSSSPT